MKGFRPLLLATAFGCIAPQHVSGTALRVQRKAEDLQGGVTTNRVDQLLSVSEEISKLANAEDPEVKIMPEVLIMNHNLDSMASGSAPSAAPAAVEAAAPAAVEAAAPDSSPFGLPPLEVPVGGGAGAPAAAPAAGAAGAPAMMIPPSPESSSIWDVFGSSSTESSSTGSSGTGPVAVPPPPPPPPLPPSATRSSSSSSKRSERSKRPTRKDRAKERAKKRRGKVKKADARPAPPPPTIKVPRTIPKNATFTKRFRNINYYQLIEHEDLKASFEEAVKVVLVGETGDGLTYDDIVLKLSAGSVIVKAYALGLVPERISIVRQNLCAAPYLDYDLAYAVKYLDGMDKKAATGDVEKITVDPAPECDEFTVSGAHGVIPVKGTAPPDSPLIPSQAESGECNPACIPGRGVCGDGICFCKDPWHGVRCELEMENKTRLVWTSVLMILATATVIGFLIADIVWRLTRQDEAAERAQGVLGKVEQKKEKWVSKLKEVPLHFG
eukprot:TRINITY_DN7572_c0_g1_i1.p1 TRINITY_DN7572_c0_g1~~TRINITY_DN7572_c0_g1_i1.p1  ORF type:complete len:497 (-),score=98.48 TRINITY_DN7572_c0_g1_i1:124-1614(-)